MKSVFSVVLGVMLVCSFGCKTAQTSTNTSPMEQSTGGSLVFPEPSQARDGLGALLYARKSDIPDCSVAWTEAEARYGMRTLECLSLTTDGLMGQVIVQLKTFEGRITQVGTSKRGMEMSKASALLATLKKERESLGCKPSLMKAGMQFYKCGDYQVILGIVKVKTFASVVQSYVSGDEVFNKALFKKLTGR